MDCPKCLKCEKPETLSTAVLSVLRTCAFFDDVHALAFTLHPIKQSIAALESQSCTLADCFFGLARLGAAIKKLPNNDHRPFDIEIGDTETSYTWWFFIEDSFPKNKDYLVQLALKLFSITPHAAGSYYHANAKKELPYYGTEKSTEEIHQILTDAHLNPDQDLLELKNDLLDYYNNEKEIVIGEEEELDIDNVLNLDAFVGTLSDIIEDSIDSIGKEIQDNDRVDIPEP
ncbi:hypothetical protein RhiirC2_797601 [Rhizophagus irregularis]|uniref:HAT C-terminal dimerisation domain-containing protein n=1 Tax=Rhizophagus irregularis TaxID=588596 RepID=A0A2N1M7T9_9GLOM|nr:hypothetical protein RhiirC2_797601 [Rhizophagus irregularis]